AGARRAAVPGGGAGADPCRHRRGGPCARRRAGRATPLGREGRSVRGRSAAVDARLGGSLVADVIRVAVLGAAGRMGRTVCDAVEAADGLELVAALDADDDVAEVSRAAAQVAVDFTVPSVTEANVHALVDAGVHAVVGTTGWDDASLARVREHLADAPGVGVLIAPNFALGAVLAMRFAAAAARWFESAEVIELHHPNKVDAPSGTARHTA